MYYQLGRAGRALDRFGVIEFATTIAPGVRDVLLTGKVYEAVQRNAPQQGRTAQYDAVVLDAPPTGRITQFLNVNSELAGLAKVGPIKTQADTVMTLFRSPRTAVHLVTVLEEMPVQETADGIAELRAAGLPVGGVVVNLVRPRDLGPTPTSARRAPARLDREADRRRPGRGRHRRRRRRSSTALLAEARDHAERRALEDAQRAARRRPRTCRRTSCPGWPAASTSAGSTSWPPLLQGAGAGMSTGTTARRRRPARPPPPTRRAAASTSTRCSTTRGTGIIVCCGSGGVGKTTTSAALALRAAERGRKVVVLTIDPARRLAQSMGIEALDNTPRPVPGVDRPRRRLARRDDARHEAHLRRGGARARPARRRRSRSWTTRSTSPCRARSPARRSTWRWRSSARSTARRAGRGQLRPDRGRHPAVALGAGLPRRPRAALAASSTAASSGCCWPRPRGPAQADDGRAVGWSPTR